MEIVNNGLLAAFDVAPDGAARVIGWDEIDAPIAPQHWRWVHFHRNSAEAQAWLLDGDVPPNGAAWALMAEDTRPRFAALDGGDVLFLRGINLNPGSEPEDMVSLRLFVNETHIASVALRNQNALDGLIEDCREGEAPGSPGAFIETLVRDLHFEVEPVLDELQQIIEQREFDALDDKSQIDPGARAAFIDARQDAVMLKRHLVPQAAAIREIVRRNPGWIDSAEALTEEAVAFERVVEDLDSLRERAQVIREEMSVRQSERMNETMMILSIVSVIFLPITFVTGLMGMNVGGLPLSASPYGFWVVCALMAICIIVAGGLVWWILRRRG